jgi:hypothetical protein
MAVAKDYKFNAEMKSGMGYRTVNAIGSDRRAEDVIADALDALGVKPGEMFQITISSTGGCRLQATEECGSPV